MKVVSFRVLKIFMAYWTLLILGLWLGTGTGNAQEVSDFSPHSDEEKQVGARLFRAWGEHTCWSDTSIGHRCRVEDVNFTSCDEARHYLEQQRCCHLTEYGGSSVGFELKLCTLWH